MATDRENLKAAQRGQAGSMAGLVLPDKAINDVHSRAIDARLTDGGTAATAHAEEPVISLPRRAFAKSVTIVTPVTAAANGTNFVTFNVRKRPAAGGAAVVVATVNTSVTGTTAWIPVAATLTPANVQFEAGDVLTVEAAKSGTGVAFAAATAGASVTVDFEEN